MTLIVVGVVDAIADVVVATTVDASSDAPAVESFVVDVVAVVEAGAFGGGPSDFPKSPKDNFRLSFVFRGLKVLDDRRASDKLALDVAFLPPEDWFLLSLLLLLLVLALLAERRRPAAPEDE